MMKMVVLACFLAMATFRLAVIKDVKKEHDDMPKTYEETVAALVVNQDSSAACPMPIAKPGDFITMTAKNPDGRLCPVVSCDMEISRIPAGTKLRVIQTYIHQAPAMDMPWYRVDYKGKKGWVSEMLTDRVPYVGKDWSPRNPGADLGVFNGILEGVKAGSEC